MIKLTIWLDYPSMERLKETTLWVTIESIILRTKCIAFRTEVTEVID